MVRHVAFATPPWVSQGSTPCPVCPGQGASGPAPLLREGKGDRTWGRPENECRAQLRITKLA